MSTAEQLRSPWPGPRPYLESEWRLFYGRRREVDEVRERISAQRLTVLTGRSGTGKTSLLCAGIIPALRLRRFRGRDSTPWPVLVLRQWGASQHTDLESLVRSELERSIAALGEWIDEGERVVEDQRLLASALEETPAGEPLLETIERLTSSSPEHIGGLILVFDQLEEVLRLGTAATRDVTELLRDLYESRVAVRLLLSLREEYLGDLRGLERSVGGLMGRAVFLSPMVRQTAREAVRAAAEEAHIKVASDAIEEVFRWLGIASSGGEEPSEERDEAPDLLTLQAILHELFTEALTGASGTPRLDLSTLDRYRTEYGPDEERLAGRALSRWIERAFESGSAEVSLDPAVEMSQDRFLALVQRVAVRIAPHLSSAGYKVAQEESDLFRKSVGEDIWALGLRDPELRGKVQILRSPVATLDFEGLGLDSSGSGASSHLSGVALEQGWDRSRTARHLVAAFLAALERLAARNVVKPGFSWEGGRTRRWELVHDGLGQPFVDWAQERRDSWEDCAASIVAARGISPIGLWPNRPPRAGLDHSRWEGCHVAPVVTEGGVLLEGLDFLECVLRGTIFEDLVFRGCRFLRCDLSGSVFRRCTFEVDGGGKPTEFVNCSPASLAILDSKLAGVRFDNCELSQLTLKGCKLTGEVPFSETSALLSLFVLLQAMEPDQKLIFDSSCTVEYCSGDEASWRLIRFDCPTLSSGPLGKRSDGEAQSQRV